MRQVVSSCLCALKLKCVNNQLKCPSLFIAFFQSWGQREEVACHFFHKCCSYRPIFSFKQSCRTKVLWDSSSLPLLTSFLLVSLVLPGYEGIFFVLLGVKVLCSCSAGALWILFHDRCILDASVERDELHIFLILCRLDSCVCFIPNLAKRVSILFKL